MSFKLSPISHAFHNFFTYNLRSLKRFWNRSWFNCRESFHSSPTIAQACSWWRPSASWASTFPFFRADSQKPRRSGSDWWTSASVRSSLLRVLFRRKQGRGFELGTFNKQAYLVVTSYNEVASVVVFLNLFCLATLSRLYQHLAAPLDAS